MPLTAHAALLALLLAGAAPHQAETPGYVGGRQCATCHAKQARLHQGSHHDLAMQPATPQTVRGNFANATFTYAGVTSTFFRRGGRYFVRTDGPDGKLHEYPIAWTFGVDPLQQYLVEFPDGRLQALSIAWDTRPKAAGGQRWYHLYPDESVSFRDELHWTGPAQNWNYMCASCHSTGLQRRFDAKTRRFDTTWAEVDVSCEACHGPGAAHVAWARRGGGDKTDASKGLTVDLAARGVWTLHDGEPIARLAAPREGQAQLETCGRCHARAAQIAEEDVRGQPLAQTHRPALLEEGLYHADGQMLGEVYEYGSFAQSRMHAAGVVCSDCHDAHSGRLRAEGNALCSTCHRASVYDVPTHHLHEAGSAAAQCVTCHMPARDYMGHDRRHDHSFRIPRPDLSLALGMPNACTDCHTDRDATWAAEAVHRSYGPTRSRGPAYAKALAAGRWRTADGGALLDALIDDPAAPAIARATALSLLGPYLSPREAARVERALRDPDPLVRGAAVELLAGVDPRHRWPLGTPLLADPVRSVRLAAVDALADATDAASPAQRSAFDQAAAEFRAAQMLNADRAESWLNLGSLDARLGESAAAEAAYRRALEIDPAFAPAAANLADLYRQLGRDAAGEAVLRQALARRPTDPALQHALGLLLVRLQRRDEALDALRAAATQAPRNPRYTYVYAVALHDAGRRPEAIGVLEEAHRRAGGDRDVLAALISFHGSAGNQPAAAEYARRLQALD